MMKGRDHAKGAPPAADLLVCFPSRGHLSLMPKPICSPARPPDQTNKRLHHLKKSGTRGTAAGQASPLMWAAKSKSFGGGHPELASEPTSPKVTCAGQIKVRHKAGGPCKSWQSVMEEIEKLHETNRRKKNRRREKRSGWAEALGLKREVMQFLTCLRTIRLDFRCFHGGADITTDDDDDEDEEEEFEEDVFKAKSAEEEEAQADRDPGQSSSTTTRTVFSKWFMVLQEQQLQNDCPNQTQPVHIKHDDNDDKSGEPAVPPPNALLLMRCRSAPAKSWLEEREEEEKAQAREEEEEEEEEVVEIMAANKVSQRSLRKLMDEDEKEKTTKESVVVMRYYDNADLYSIISSDIAKETWLVGGITDALSRSRSCKR